MQFYIQLNINDPGVKWPQIYLLSDFADVIFEPIMLLAICGITGS